MTNFDEEQSPEEQNMPKESTNELPAEDVKNVEKIKLKTEEPVDVRITVEDAEEAPKTSVEYKTDSAQEIAFTRTSEEQQMEPEIKTESIPEENDEKKPKNYKKYVFRIQQEYTAFLDALSYDEKNKIINKSLKEIIANQSSEKRKMIFKEAVRHLIIILVTLIIGIPLTFKIVNFSIKSTLKSYKYMQVNFEKLYQQKQLEKF